MKLLAITLVSTKKEELNYILSAEKYSSRSVRETAPSQPSCLQRETNFSPGIFLPLQKRQRSHRNCTSMPYDNLHEQFTLEVSLVPSSICLLCECSIGPLRGLYHVLLIHARTKSHLPLLHYFYLCLEYCLHNTEARSQLLNDPTSSTSAFRFNLDSSRTKVILDVLNLHPRLSYSTISFSPVITLSLSSFRAISALCICAPA